MERISKFQTCRTVLLADKIKDLEEKIDKMRCEIRSLRGGIETIRFSLQLARRYLPPISETERFCNLLLEPPKPEETEKRGPK